MQHSMTSTVSRSRSTLHRGAFAHILHMPAKGPLIDGTIGIAREWHARMFKLINRSRCLTHHIFNGVLVAEPIGALDRVIHMPGPMVG